MTAFFRWGAAMLSLALTICASAAGVHRVAVTVRPKVKYQTIRGWSATPWYPNISPWLRDQLLDAAVNDLGLTRIRWGPPGGNRSTERDWEWENDDGDPAHLRWEAFNTAAADRGVRTWVLPFKRRVEANGDPFEVWVSPSFFNRGSTGAVPAWLLHSPGEYAEYATAFLLHLKRNYGIEADFYVILNEAGNNNPFSPQVVARMIRTLGPRLRALGLRTKIQFPDCINANTSWRYIQAVKNDPDVWKYVGALSYHLYGNNSDRTRIRDFARARGLPTGQTEYMGLTIDHLYDDLTLGGVSYWSIYGLAGVHPGAHNFRLNPANTAFRRGRTYWDLRQVMHYVRPGAVRIRATSDSPLLRVLAFLRDDRMTVVLINKRLPRRRGQKVRPPQPPPYRVALQGLRAGRYGLCECVAGRPYREQAAPHGDRLERAAGLPHATREQHHPFGRGDGPRERSAGVRLVREEAPPRREGGPRIPPTRRDAGLGSRPGGRIPVRRRGERPDAYRHARGTLARLRGEPAPFALGRPQSHSGTDYAAPDRHHALRMGPRSGA